MDEISYIKTEFLSVSFPWKIQIFLISSKFVQVLNYRNFLLHVNLVSDEDKDWDETDTQNIHILRWV